ncbi:hypothetical protein ACIOGZ_04145 [Kitasatospora sp. NPDC088160]
MATTTARARALRTDLEALRSSVTPKSNRHVASSRSSSANSSL